MGNGTRVIVGRGILYLLSEIETAKRRTRGRLTRTHPFNGTSHASIYFSNEKTPTSASTTNCYALATSHASHISTGVSFCFPHKLSSN